MPKTFYTERDIEDMVRSGVTSLIVDEDVALTDLAYEKARKLGMELLRENDQPPAAPVRPYIANQASPSVSSSPMSAAPPSGRPTQALTICNSASTRLPWLAWEIQSTQSCWRRSSGVCSRALAPNRVYDAVRTRAWDGGVYHQIP